VSVCREGKGREKTIETRLVREGLVEANGLDESSEVRQRAEAISVEKEFTLV